MIHEDWSQAFFVKRIVDQSSITVERIGCGPNWVRRSTVLWVQLVGSFFPGLNDPFECIVPSFLDTPSDILRSFLEEKVREFRPGLTCDQIREGAAAIDLERLRQDMQNDVDKVGILSLTERRDDLLMWSHYANSHRGLCLEFATSIYEVFFGRTQPVVYSGERSIFDPREPETKRVENVVLTKSKHWTYELEWPLSSRTVRGRTSFPQKRLPA
jgi:hypothetical protein